MTGKVLPDTFIKDLIKIGAIPGAKVSNINPSSLDLILSHEKWKVMGSFLPLEGQTIRNALNSDTITDTINTKKEEFYMERSQPYVVRLVETLKLPKGITAKIFNKSGGARVGMSVKGLVDGVPRYDLIPEGYSGEIYAEVCATAIQSVFQPNKTAMLQIRFYEGDPKPILGAKLTLLLENHPILLNERGKRSYDDNQLEEILASGKMTFTADLSGKILAYLSRREGRTFSFSKRNYYDPDKFFKAKLSREGNKSIFIPPGDFAIIKSTENMRLPHTHAAEISPYSSHLGDIRSSYADLVNAGHGFDENNSNIKGHIFFEVRSRDTPIIIQDGQPIAQFGIYEMLEEPKKRYMANRTTNFDNLSSFLPEQFKRESGGNSK